MDIGDKLGPYEIRAEIGKGGMATVYRAYQPAVDRDVAIKLINKGIISDTNSKERFQREARIVARLEHPYVLPIYDFDGTTDLPHIVMRYVDGGTLKDMLQRGPLTVDQISKYLRQIASALDYAHEKDIIHRDIKPSNILIDRNSNAFVADFGIARALHEPDQHATLTDPNTTIGTPGYMAPEQSTGSDPLTPQADIYSLGVMFFEMITGQLPYKADNGIALILKHCSDPIPSAADLNPHLPRAIDGIIARVMAKTYTERYASATEFVEAALAVLNGSGPQRPITQVEGSKSGSGLAASAAAIPNEQTVLGAAPVAAQQHTPALHLSISLLGSVQIALNGQPVTTFEYNHIRALLVFVVMERDSVHRRDALAELLWPDQPGKKGRDSLRTALSKLRKAIRDQDADPAYLLADPDTLQFNQESNFTLDTDEFTKIITACSKHAHMTIESCAECVQRLERAIELYRGPFAQDLALPDADEFGKWLDFTREEFQAKALDALIVVANYYEQHGDYDLARRYAWRQIELEPWREEAYRQLMRLLALSGQRTAALVQYARCCRILDEELAVSPSPETVALYEKIRASEIGPEPRPPGLVQSARRSNIPTALTSFIGRDTEINHALLYLADPACHVVTITGLGGMGKTRLALEVAAQAASIFPNVYFVSPVSLNSPDLMPSAIADALQFSTVNQGNFAAELIGYLSDKNLLLVLDNLEHLTKGMRLLAEIVGHAPGVKLLLTSREKLNLPGEWVLSLEGLPIVTAASSEDTADGAVALFVQRARMVQPNFVYSRQVLPDILRICQLVNGMPLGIELAAAWMQMLSCREIADGIASSLAFLDSSRQDLPERHQSLRAVFEHSWNLLSSEQQRVFKALSVFRGGFQADAALEVAGATLPSLLAFVSKSLLHRDPDGRYEIHELLRQYALEKLRESGDSKQVFARHLEFFANLAASAESQIRGGQQIPWLERLEAENDNLRMGLEWSLANEAADSGLRLAASLWFFWHVRNYFREGFDWLQKLIAAAPAAPNPVRAKALFAAGWMAQNSRDLAQAAALSLASFQMAQQLGDKQGIAYPLSTLAWLDYFQGNYEQATRLGEESLSLFRAVKDSWGIVHTLNILGYIAESQADYERADDLQREGITIARTAGDNDSLAWSLYLLGRIMAERSQYEEAIELCNESLDIYREMHNPFSIAVVLYTLGASALGLGDYARAIELAEESVNLLREMSDFWAIGGPLSCLGMVAYRQGDLARATELSQESYSYFSQFGDKRGMAYALNTLGCVAQQQQHNKEAIDLFRESLILRRDADIRRGMDVCFDRLAEIATVQGEPERAAWLFGAAEALRERLDVPVSEDSFDQHSRCVDRAQQELGDSRFRLAWMQGRTMSLDEAITRALNDTVNPV